MLISLKRRRLLSFWANRLKVISCGIAISTCSFAHAHLMVAQQGTLNIVNNDVFMVLSLPINADGQVSILEFNYHRASIVATVKDNVLLTDKNGKRTLQGFLLSPVISHEKTDGSLSQVTVMGRFNIENCFEDLQFHAGLFGHAKSEQTLKITATRKQDSKKHTFQLEPQFTEITLFSENVD
jgi:hypothetical protein